MEDMPHDDRAEVERQLATTLSAVDHAQPLTWQIGESARTILGGNGAAITLAYTSNVRITVAATDAVSERIEDLQDITGEGPGHDAYIGGDVVTTFLDPAASTKWPTFSEAALNAFGPLAIHAVPMRPSGAAFGVLTIYKREIEPLQGPEESAQFLGDAIGVTLLRDPQSQTDIDEAGGGSWASRAPINQAAGMVAAELSISPNDALTILKAKAYALDCDLLTIARTTLRHELRLP